MSVYLWLSIPFLIFSLRDDLHILLERLQLSLVVEAGIDPTFRAQVYVITFYAAILAEMDVNV